MFIDYDGINEGYQRDLALSRSNEARWLLSAMADGEIGQFALRFIWEICDYCNGDGGHSRRFGSFSAEEWDEHDEEFQQDYLSGRFDERCEICNGSGKVRTLDEEGLPEDAAEWLENERQSSWESAAERRAERMAGA